MTAAVVTTQVALLALLLGGWALISRDEVWANLVGSPGGVATQLGNWFQDSAFWLDVGLTGLEAALGYVLGVLIAVVLVAIIVPVRTLDRFFAPFIAMANALPKIVLAPLFILWLGFSITSKVLFVAAGIFFLIFYGVYSGVRSIDTVLLDNARALGATRVRLLLDVYLPSIVGWLIASLRLSSAWALTGAVVSEYLGSNSGVGYRIALAQQTLDPSAVISGIVAVAVLAVVVDRLLVLVERRYTQWRVF
jgi:NitT/TauT family transport system permease protein